MDAPWWGWESFAKGFATLSIVVGMVVLSATSPGAAGGSLPRRRLRHGVEP